MEAPDSVADTAGQPDTPDKPAGQRARSLRELAEALAVGKSTAGDLVRDGILPAKGPDGWDLAAARAALAAYRAGGAPAPAPMSTAPDAPMGCVPQGVAPKDGHAEAPAAGARDDDDEGASLEGALELGEDPVAVARAAMRLASRALVAKKARARDHERLASALRTLRAVEAGYLELEERRGDLIERSVSKACLGAVAQRLVLACQRLEVRAAAQVELWIADATFRALSAEERQRAVRAWVAQQTKQVRVEESGGDAWAAIEQLVAREVAVRRRP